MIKFMVDSGSDYDVNEAKEKGIAFEEAVDIVTKTCAYTNHTILAEALEKWPRAYLDSIVPQLKNWINLHAPAQKMRRLLSLTLTILSIWHTWISILPILPMVWQLSIQKF